MFRNWLQQLALRGGTRNNRSSCRPRRNRLRLRPVLQVQPLETRTVPAGTWTSLTNLAPGGLGTMMLTTDGSIMAQGGGVTNQWFKLTPSSTGSYQSGTWSSLASMNLQRLYFGSNVLKDGRVFIVGEEYSGP